jgi:hypothetical protein
MYEYDNKFMYTDAAGGAGAHRARRRGDRPGDPRPGPDAPTGSAARIEDALGFPYRAEDWQTMNSSLFSALSSRSWRWGSSSS